MSLGLALAYAAVAALLLNLNLASAWSWKVKVTTILLVSALYAGTWVGIRELEGWPTALGLPERFEVQWVAIDEPDPSSGSPGGIYFWVRELEAEGGVSPPRAHGLPFDDPTAEEARDALSLLQEGKRVEGRITMQPLELDREARDEDADLDDDHVPPGAGPEDRPSFEFREMPPPDLPAKPAL